MARIVLFVISFAVLAVIAYHYVSGGLSVNNAGQDPKAMMDHVRQSTHEVELQEQKNADEIQKKMQADPAP